MTISMTASMTAASDAGRYVSARPLWICAALLLVAPFWQMHWGTVPDTGWLIDECERILAGDRLYVDLIETNPPFSVWFYMPVVWLAQKTGLAAEPLVQAYTYVLVLVGLGLAGFIARRAQFTENAALFRFAPLFLALFIFYPGSAFTERDHIGTALLLPLLVLTAWRAWPASPTRPGVLLAILAGVSGSVLVMVKPYYAAAVLAPAMFAAWRSRRWTTLLAPEYWTIGLVSTAYLAAVAVFHPEFLRDIYPLLAETYLRISVYRPILFNYGITLSLILLAAWFLTPVGRIPELVAVALLASSSSFGVALYQAKGWPYHLYPAFALALTAVLCSLAARSGYPAAAGRRWQPSLALLLVAALASWMPFRFSQKPDAGTIATLRNAIDNPSVAMIGSDLAVAYPLTRMIGGRWTSAYSSDWLGSFAERLREDAMRNGKGDDAIRYERIVANYAAVKRREFERARPDIVLVQKADGIWSGQLINDFGFAAILADYRPLVEDDTTMVYLRKDSGKRPTATP